MINDICYESQSMAYYWKLVRDFVDGEHTIKENRELYLPRKGGQSPEDYEGYLARAKPGDYTGQILESLHGMIMRRSPSVEKPESKELDECVKDFDKEGHSLYQHASDVFHDNMQTNFGGILVDMPSIGHEYSVYEAEERGIRPYARYYPAETIMDWGYRQVDSYRVLEFVVLKEVVERKDIFGTGTRKEVMYRIPCLDADGKYCVRIFAETRDENDREKVVLSELTAEPVYVYVNGELLDYIPFVFTPDKVAKAKLDKPMLYGVAELHKHYYMQSADYENGVHYTTIPTLWTTGHDMDSGAKEEKEDALILGGDSSLNLPESDARIGVVQFAGEGLLYSKQAKEETLEQIGITGSRAMSPDKAMSETSDAAKIHRAGENARLATYTRNMSECYTRVLQIMAEWLGVDGNVSVQFNVDYDTVAFDPNALNSIANLSREGKFPLPLVFEALKKGEYLPADFELQDYMLLLEMELSGASVNEILDVYRKIRSGEKVEVPDFSVVDAVESIAGNSKKPEDTKQVSMENGK